MQTVHRPTGDDRPGKQSCSCGWASPDKPCTVEMWRDNHYFPDYASREGVKNILIERIIAELIEAALQERVYRWKLHDSNVVALAWGWWFSANLSARALATLFGLDHSEEAIPLFPEHHRTHSLPCRARPTWRRRRPRRIWPGCPSNPNDVQERRRRPPRPGSDAGSRMGRPRSRARSVEVTSECELDSQRVYDLRTARPSQHSIRLVPASL